MKSMAHGENSADKKILKYFYVESKYVVFKVNVQKQNISCG